ncbi:8328_t:CDS:2 [Scutellospora calospora]|uniref:8328_t:CDS:1 n=1 Tax=Scutellospora calospora TaxID=85575 RepID=A0ACA9KVH7_9GLOM|nr:8328_t:CDS:2 [Scutellospora calospora]
MSEYIFEESLISDIIQGELPRGVTQCLDQLSVMGDISEENFIDRFEKMKRAGGYYIIVIENDEKRVVATGTLFVEMKFIRGCGKAGHIEDIVVHDSQRGKSFGKKIIEQLKDIGSKVDCYKIILDCKEHNVPFYNKCGLERKEVQMAYYYNEEKKNQNLHVGNGVLSKEKE